MKPDWKDAPEWANWRAMDQDGDWFWYESQPVYEHEAGEWYAIVPNDRTEIRIELANARDIGADETLEQRPR